MTKGDIQSRLPRSPHVFVSLAIVMLALLSILLSVRADEAPVATNATPQAPSSNQYRRIFVPADKMEAWPRDGEKLIPIEAHDFDELIRSANAAATQSNQVAISEAEYSAHLGTDGQLHGEGRWTIVAHNDKPAFLPLGDLSLILGNAHWQDAPQQSARIGLWAKNNRIPSRIGLEVTRSGTLQFDWHAQTHSTDDRIQMPWIVPPANSARLIVDLPEGKQPQIDGGVVLESMRQPADDKTPGKPLRRWVIGLSVAPSATFRIDSGNHKSLQASAKILLHEEVYYRIGPRGLDLTATWLLTGVADPKRELSVAVPSGLQLSSVKSEGQDVAWHLMRDASSPTDTALIDLPKSDRAKPIQLTLSAWQPVVVHAPWRLPRLRPEGVFWSSGKLELSVAAAHELQHLSTSDCVETATSGLKDKEDSLETHSFTAYTSSAAIEVHLSERQTDATVRAGSSLTLADPNLNGRLVTQWNLSHGVAHQLVGKLSPGWIVEALETIPADAMAEWFIDRNGNDKRIEIQLSRAATAARNVTVIITARLQRFNLNEPISAETMKMVRWDGAKPALHLLTFQSNEPYAVVPIGKLPEIALDAVPSDDRQLLDQATENKIFNITEAGNNAGMQLTVHRGQFVAHINLEPAYENDVLRQDYRLSIEPKSGPIDRVLVYATSPLGEGMRWTDRITNASIAAEKLASNDVHRAALPKEGEVWLLRFPQPISRPIEIAASISNKRPEHASLPLVFLPEAAQQDARILVRSSNQGALWLEPTHLETVPLPADEATTNASNGIPPVSAAYRYQPADCRDPALTPKLAVSVIPESKTIPLIARHIQLESFVWPDGNGADRATYELDDHAATELKVDMPSGERLVSASLDGHPLDVAKPTSNGQSAQIHLAAQAGSSQLSLCLETQRSPLAAGRELAPPSIFSELPFITGDWIVWLPEEYSAAGTGISDAAPKFNWRERVFGVLGRPTGARPFDPFQFADGVVTSPTADASDSQSKRETPEGNSLAFANSTESIAPLGWRRYHESFIASGPASITVTHPPAITAWAVALLLASFLCGRWIQGVRAEVFAIALAAAAASALFLPFAYANLASGAVLGLLLSLILDLPRHRLTASEPADQPRSKLANTVAILGVFAVCLAKVSYAQSAQSTSATPVPNKIYRVMIPTDAEGHPVSTKYYVSDDFLRALTTATSRASQSQNRWLLRGATYNGELIDRTALKVPVAANWTFTFSVETLARDTTVVLPLVRNEAVWNSTAMLDGVPLPVAWHNDGHGCAVEITEPGEYSLSLTCNPKTTTAGGRKQIDLAIPGILGAKTQIRYSESVNGVTVANASILPPATSPSTTLDAELDRINRLHVEWSRTEKSENGTSGFSVTELRWIHVKPDELEMSVKYLLEGGARRPDAITVEYDDRWKLLTSEDSLNAKSSAAGSSGARGIRIPIPAPSADHQEISLRWRLVDPPSLGNLRLPPIELTSIQPTKRWLAMSNDISLNCEIPDASATDGTANELLAKWGDSEAKDPPEWVLSNFDPRRANNLAIRPRETEPIVEESLNVSAGLTTLRANYEATITPGLAGANRVELSVPINLSINGIAVTEDDRPIPVRWSRFAKNRVNAFFAERLTKPYRLVLDGTTPVDPDGKATLPHVSTLATEDATQKTRLYREDDVQVSIEGLSAKNDPKAEPPGPPPAEWPVRPVTICYLETGSATARLAVKPNKFKIAGDSLTSLARENGAWWVNYRCQFGVEDGSLDILRLQLPINCTGPFEVQSALPVTTELKSLDDRTNALAIRFATTVAKGGSIDVRIRSPLKPLTGTQVSVPAITFGSPASGHRYIGVPETADSQSVTWAETGVSPAIIPQKLRTTSAAPISTRYLEVVNDPFQVASRPLAAPEIEPQIRLADTAIIAGDRGTQRVNTSLILAPHGLTKCTIQLPPNQSLVSVELDGRPALIRQINPSQWQLTLGAPQLPQSLHIVSRTSGTTANSTTTDPQRATLLAHGQPIPAEMSLWSFARPNKSVSCVVTGADEVNANEQAALRFDRLVSIAEAAKATAAELPPPDGYNWFQPWAKSLTTARTETLHTMKAPPIVRVESQVSHTAEDQINQASARLDKWLDECRKTLIAPDSNKPAPTAAISNSPSSQVLASPAAEEWTYYVAEGGNDRLALRFQSLELTPTQNRVVGLLIIAGSLTATIWLMRCPVAIDFLYRWPHACGVLLGIAYWAWLWPSWLGILITTASLWMAVRFAWPGRSLRTEASTVLRASRTT